MTLAVSAMYALARWSAWVGNRLDASSAETGDVDDECAVSITLVCTSRPRRARLSPAGAEVDTSQALQR
jgi:hypothetical protein